MGGSSQARIVLTCVLVAVGAAGCGDGDPAPKVGGAPSSSFYQACGPVFSPDGTKIAYALRQNGTTTVYLMNADGSGKTAVTPKDVSLESPAFAPDGKRLVLASTTGGIHVIKVDGTGLKALTKSGLDDRVPSFSRDGKRIAWVREVEGEGSVWVMAADGSGQRSLGISSGAFTGPPAFSPDGKRIAFVAPAADRPEPGDIEVWTMDLNGKSRKQITKHSGGDWAPSFSSDGKRIVFVSIPDDSVAEVFVMDADGGNQVQLTDNDSVDFEPSFSPDGKRIVFVSQRDSDQDVYIMNADGTGQTRITAYAADPAAP